MRPPSLDRLEPAPGDRLSAVYTAHIPDADVAVIAGDVCASLTASVAWAAQTIGDRMPVVMVAGNHEFYG